MLAVETQWLTPVEQHLHWAALSHAGYCGNPSLQIATMQPENASQQLTMGASAEQPHHEQQTAMQSPCVTPGSFDSASIWSNERTWSDQQRRVQQCVPLVFNDAEDKVEEGSVKGPLQAAAECVG